MSEYIEVGQPLQFTDPNTPTRVGEIVENVSDIYNIPSPRLGMQVFVKSEKKSFVITSLKSKVIGGVDVPEAAVEAFEPVGAKSITWNNNTNPSNMNDFVVAGVYDIKGEHTRIDDNLPILNTGGGHTFNARLTVLDSSISGSGKDDDKCITQVLSFSNRLGQGEVYIRTGKGSSLDNLTWENWSTLQRNVNVDTVTSLDHLIDNGIYSGVYVKNAAEVETFVMVVINNYAAASQKDMPKSVSQFKYSVILGGSFVKYETRVGGGNPVSFPYGWEILNKNEIDSMISAEIKKVNDRISTLIDDNDPDTLDSIKDLINWVNEHGGVVEGLRAAINANADKIDQTIDYVSEEVTKMNTADNTIKAAALKYDGLTTKTTPTNVEIKTTSVDLKNNFTFNIPSATEEKAGVMSAADKVALNKATTDIKANADAIAEEVEKLKNGSTIVAQAREIHSRNGKTVTDSFLARTTAGSGTIGDGVATLKSVGGNIVKNLVDSNWGFGDNLGKWQRMGNTTYNINGDFINVNFETTWLGIQSLQNLNSSHKYYMAVCAFGNLSNIVLRCGGISKEFKLAGTWRFISNIFSGLSSELRSCSIRATEVGEATFYKPILIDLTEMFGDTKANQMTKEKCDKLFSTMDALPQGLSIANPREFKSTGYNQADPNKVLVGKGIDNGAIVNKVGSNLTIVPCLPCKIGEGENNGYCIHGAFDEGAENVYLTPLNPKDVEGELYLCELTKDADKGTYIPQIKGYMLVEVPDATDLCVHFLWSEDRVRHDFEPYYESKVELPTIPEMPEYGLAGIQSSGTLACDEIDLVKGTYRKKIGVVDMGSLNWLYSPTNKKFYYDYLPMAIYGGVMTTIYTTANSGYLTSNVADKSIYSSANSNRLHAYDTAYSDAATFKAAMQGVILYYEFAEPIEYPLPKVDNNYISSDYGVEQFDGGVPCNANNLYYMRSLAGETRNFLDRLMAGLGTSDATVVADRILAVVNPAVANNDIIEDEV